jgi:hypothetical protein
VGSQLILSGDTYGAITVLLPNMQTSDLKIGLTVPTAPLLTLLSPVSVRTALPSSSAEHLTGFKKEMARAVHV